MEIGLFISGFLALLLYICWEVARYEPPHKCKYTIPVVYMGCKMLKCEFDGCNCYDPTPQFNEDMKKTDELLERYNHRPQPPIK